MDYKIGDIVEGKVSSIKEFGAFVKLKDSSVGFIHISDLSNKYVENVSDLLKVGQTIKAAIKKVGGEKGRMALSIKQLEKQIDSQIGSTSQCKLNSSPIQKFQSNRFHHRETSKSPSSKSSKNAQNDRFEDMLRQFKKVSDENIHILKKGERYTKQRRSDNNF